MEKNFDEIFEITNFPSDNLIENAQSAWLGMRSEDNQFTLLFKLSDSIFWVSSQFSLPQDINLCQNPQVNFENDSLKIECRFMRGIMIGVAFQMKDLQLVFIGEYTYDLNEAVYLMAIAAIKENDPLKYCQAYEGAQYYPDYAYRVHEAMVWADSLAFAFYQQKKYRQAAELIKKMETSCWFSTHEAFAAEFPEDYKKIWGNASLYYLKAEKYDDCVLLCERLLSQFPTLKGVYLQYADALFSLKKNNYQIYYQKYKENMQKEGKQKSIPQRVSQRLKKTK